MKKGFTLIEILVSIGLLLVLVGIGVANYVSFDERQQLKQTKELIRQSISQAQNFARSGKLQGCKNLENYEVSFLGPLVQIKQVCDDTDGNTGEIAETYDLPDGVSFTTDPANPTLYVAPITGLVTNNSGSTGPFTVTFEQTGTEATGSVEIDHAGIVKEIADE